MNKGLEALEFLSKNGYLNIPTPKPNTEWTDEDDKAVGCGLCISKELKAFEIIKNKCSIKLEENLDTNYHNYYGYLIIKDKHLFNGTLTLDIKAKEEYDLLKEVLKNG